MEQLVPRRQLERIKGSGHRFASEACFSSGGVWRVSYRVEHLECFESQDRRRFFSSGPDIGFKGISYDPPWAGTLTSGNFLLVFFGGAEWGFSCFKGLPRCLTGKESACQCRRHVLDPWVGKISWRRAWQPTPVFLPGESHGRGAWQATVHRVTKSQTQPKWLRTCTHTWLLYNVALVSVVQGSESVTCIHTSLPCWAPFHPPCHSSRSPQSTELSSLWFPLALFSTRGSSTSWQLDGYGGLLSSCWKSGPQTSSFKWEALLQVKELEEKILTPLWNISASSPRQARKESWSPGHMLVWYPSLGRPLSDAMFLPLSHPVSTPMTQC